MQVNSPCGEQKRRNALAEMQSLNPSAVVWQGFISLYWPFYIYLYSAGYTGSPEHLMLSQIVNSRWILRLYKRPHISVCALIHQVVVFGSCRPAQESTRFLFLFLFQDRYFVCLAFLWHSIKCKLETLNCVFFFFFFTVQTKKAPLFPLVWCKQCKNQLKDRRPGCVWSQRRATSPSKMSNKAPVMNHFQDALKCVSKCAGLFVCTRGVSYFHTSYDFKIFCDTFFNNVTVYKITLFFYQLQFVPPCKKQTNKKTHGMNSM